MANLKELARFGVPAEKATWVLPPYEYYNAESVAALESLGMNVINLTPGTATNADYTTPDMPNYRSSDRLIEALYKFESKAGLNGAIILIHPGVQESRTDALYKRLPEMIRKMTSLPAHVYGLARKGQIKEGMDADLILVDFSAPHLMPCCKGG